LRCCASWLQVTIDVALGGVLTTGIEPDDLRYEVGLSELGEWMNCHS
jgi:hypothetical protein